MNSGPAQHGEPTFLWFHADLTNFTSLLWRLFPHSGDYNWFNQGPNVLLGGNPSVTEICAGIATQPPNDGSIRYFYVIKNGVAQNVGADNGRCDITFGSTDLMCCAMQVPPVPFKRGDELEVYTAPFPYASPWVPTGDTSVTMFIRAPRYHMPHGFSSGPKNYAQPEVIMRHHSTGSVTVGAAGYKMVLNGNQGGSDSLAANIHKDMDVWKLCGSARGTPVGTFLMKLRVNGVTDAGFSCQLNSPSTDPECCVESAQGAVLRALDAGDVAGCIITKSAGFNWGTTQRSCEIHATLRP
jgi:hypothetical protein